MNGFGIGLFAPQVGLKALVAGAAEFARRPHTPSLACLHDCRSAWSWPRAILHKAYTQGDDVEQVLNGVSLEVGAGRFVSVMGPSGSGKSTLLHLLGGLDMPDCGEVAARRPGAVGA